MSDDKPAKIAYRYQPANEGDYITGIETRDYTAAEWKALEPRLQRDGLASGVYVKADAEPSDDDKADTKSKK